jgi:endoglucanase
MPRPSQARNTRLLSKATAFAASLVACLVLAAGSRAATDYVRINQVGYLSTDTKVAIAFANGSLAALSFSVVDAGTSAVVWGPAPFPASSVAYAPFSNLYQLDFSAFQPASALTCYIQLSDGTKSLNFQVGPCVYQHTEETALNFFRAQNCGTGNWYEGGGGGVAAQCHMAPGTAGFGADEDGIVVDGPNAGTKIDTEGGLHDSGDWIKFMVTAAWVDQILLFSYQENPTAFQDTLGSNLQAGAPNGVPDVLDEARYTLQWIIKMNPGPTTFYYDVADGRDHDNFGNLPQSDSESYCTAGIANQGSGANYGVVACGYRPVYGGANDQGGTNNCARAAAALAMGYQIWNAPGTGFQDTAFASGCLSHAQQLYALGKSQNTMQTDVDNFYVENDMNPELEMAAVQLYKATGTASYLSDAQGYASAAGAAGGELDWNQNNFLAHYCLYQVAPTPAVLGYMKADLDADLAISNANPCGLGYGFVWGTLENATSLVAMAQLWKKINPADSSYDRMATFNRDYLLGRNPWGVCFIQGMGTVFPLHPQHNIAMAIYPTIIPGLPAEGPDTYKEFKAQGITLSGTDPFGAFDNNLATGGWCYHDDNQDFVTNEATTTHAAWIVNVLANLAASCAVVPTPSPSPSRTPGRSATTTPSPSGTSTRSPSPTASATETPSQSPSGTRTASDTQTPSSTQTSSQTATRTVTETQSATATASPVQSPSPSQTSVPSATVSGTPMPSAIPSATPFLTPGASLTPSPLPTWSPSPSPFQTFSSSPTQVSTALPSDTPSPAASATPSRTSTPMDSPSPAPSATRTLAQSPSPSASVTALPSGTVSPLPTQSPSPASTLASSATMSPSPDTSVTPSPSTTVAGTATPSPSPSYSPTAIPSLGRTATFSPVQTSSPSPEGPTGLKSIDSATVYPNPWRGGACGLAFKLRGSTGLIHVKLFSEAMMCEFEADITGDFQDGWNHCSLVLPDFSNGCRYLRVQAGKPGLPQDVVTAKICRLD